jgi:hypothetical protein
MEAEAHRHWTGRIGNKCRLNCQALRAQRNHHFEPVGEWKDFQELATGPFELGL